MFSPRFGIFFSGEDSGTGQTMRQVVQEINTDYQSQIDDAKAGSTYDELEMSGSRAVWPEVLAVYAVKTTADPDDPQEVATVDDSKKVILKDIFWQMNDLSSRTESKTEDVITETDDGHGNIVETVTTVTRTYLYITVSHKTAEEMAEQFDFTADQRQQLSELLAEGKPQIVVIRSLRHLFRGRCHRYSGAVAGRKYRRRTILVLVRIRQPCGVVRLLCQLVCRPVRLYRHRCLPEIPVAETACSGFRSVGNGWTLRQPVSGMVIFFDWDNKGGSGPRMGRLTMWASSRRWRTESSTP